jgi:tetratricopeptide (TPR) repeat protein
LIDKVNLVVRAEELEARLQRLKGKERDVALRELGYYYLQQYLRSRNVEYVEKSLSFYKQVEKKDCVVLNNIGLCEMYLGKCQESMDVFNNARKVCKNEDEYMLDFNYALSLLSCGKEEEAYMIMKSLIKNNKSPSFIRLFGKTCISLARKDMNYVEEAVPLLESLEQPVEELVLSYIILAKAKGNEFTEKALKLARENGDERLIAEALLVKGDEKSLNEALSLFRRVNDMNGQARALYALSLVEQDKLPDALNLVEKLPDDIEKMEILFDLYKRTKMIPLLKESLRIAEKVQNWLFLARGYRELSEREDALNNLKKSVEFYEKYVNTTREGKV